MASVTCDLSLNEQRASMQSRTAVAEQPCLSNSLNECMRSYSFPLGPNVWAIARHAKEEALCMKHSASLEEAER